MKTKKEIKQWLENAKAAQKENRDKADAARDNVSYGEYNSEALRFGTIIDVLECILK